MGGNSGRAIYGWQVKSLVFRFLFLFCVRLLYIQFTISMRMCWFTSVSVIVQYMGCPRNCWSWYQCSLRLLIGSLNVFFVRSLLFCTVLFSVFFFWAAFFYHVTSSRCFEDKTNAIRRKEMHNIFRRDFSHCSSLSVSLSRKSKVSC